MTKAAATTTAVIALIWFGMLMGVSFLATPVKFRAPSLTLPVALDVGRQTFAVLAMAETALSAALVAAALAAGGRVLWPLIGTLAVVVAAQGLWLLPVLDARVQVILDGGVPAPSAAHWFYILTDMAKLALVGVIAAVALRRRGTP